METKLMNAIQLIESIFNQIKISTSLDDFLLKEPNYLESTFIDQGNSDSIDFTLEPNNMALFSVINRVFNVMFKSGKRREHLFEVMYALPNVPDEFSELRKATYIFETDRFKIPVNLDHDFIFRWLSELCGRAHAAKASTESFFAANISRFFLIGDVGTGKTTFLNNVFCRYNTYLFERKVIWIRVDLTKTIFQNQTLEAGLEQQIARVFREHYFDDLWLKHEQDIREEIKINFPSSTPKEEIERAVDNFTVKFSPGRSKSFNSYLQKGIKSWLEDNYAMIYILDGLDRINTDESFEAKIKEVQESILGFEKSQQVFIIVMRTESCIELMKSYENKKERHTGSILKKEAKIFYLIPPKLNEIVRNRIDLLSQDYKDFAFELKDMILPDHLFTQIQKAFIEKSPNVKIDLINSWLSWIDKLSLESYFRVFLLYLYRGLTHADYETTMKTWNTNETYTCLKNYFGTNFRILHRVIIIALKKFLQTIQLLNIKPEDIKYIDEWLYNKFNDNEISEQRARNMLNEILKKHYRITEAITNSPNDGVLELDYSYDQDNKLITVVNPNRKYGTFLINIFRAVNVPNSVNEKLSILAKVRILQTIKLLDINTIDHIVAVLHELFGFEEDHLRLEFEELEKFSILKREINFNTFGTRSWYYEITRVGYNILDNLIYDFNYLAMATQNIFVPTKLRKSFISDFSYSPNESLGKLNLYKIPRIVNFIELVCSIERLEAEQYSLAPRSIDFKEWAIGPVMSDKIKETINKILPSILDSVSTELFDHVIAKCNIMRIKNNLS